MSKKFRDRILEGSGYSNKKFECDFGLKLLQKMGWKGNGLGKDQQGGTECVQIKKRDEGLGLGVEEDRKKFEWNDSWWENHYNNAVKSINVIKNEDSEHTSQQSDDSSDEDVKNKKKSKVISKKISKKTTKKPKKHQSSSRSASPVVNRLRKLSNHSNYADPKTFDHLFSSCSSSSEEEIVFKKSKKEDTKKKSKNNNNSHKLASKETTKPLKEKKLKNRKASKQLSDEEEKNKQSSLKQASRYVNTQDPRATTLARQFYSEIILNQDNENAHKEGIYALCNLGDCFASSSVDKSIKVWKCQGQQQQGNVPVQQQQIQSLKHQIYLRNNLDCDGCCRYLSSSNVQSNILVGTSENYVICMDWQNKHMHSVIPCKHKLYSLMILDLQPLTILAGDCYGNMNFIQNGAVIRVIVGHSGSVNAMYRFSDETNDIIFTAGDCGEIKCWENSSQNSMKYRFDFVGHDKAKSVYFLETCQATSNSTGIASNDQAILSQEYTKLKQLLLVSGGSDKTVRLWNIQTQTAVRVITLQAPLYAACILKGSMMLVGEGENIKILDLHNPADCEILNNNNNDNQSNIHNGRVNAICRLASSAFVSGDIDGVVSLWTLPDCVLGKKENEIENTNNIKDNDNIEDIIARKFKGTIEINNDFRQLPLPPTPQGKQQQQQDQGQQVMSSKVYNDKSPAAYNKPPNSSSVNSSASLTKSVELPYFPRVGDKNANTGSQNINSNQKGSNSVVVPTGIGRTQIPVKQLQDVSSKGSQQDQLQKQGQNKDQLQQQQQDYFDLSLKQQDPQRNRQEKSKSSSSNSAKNEILIIEKMEELSGNQESEIKDVADDFINTTEKQDKSTINKPQRIQEINLPNEQHIIEEFIFKANSNLTNTPPILLKSSLKPTVTVNNTQNQDKSLVNKTINSNNNSVIQQGQKAVLSGNNNIKTIDIHPESQNIQRPMQLLPNSFEINHIPKGDKPESSRNDKTYHRSNYLQIDIPKSTLPHHSPNAGGSESSESVRGLSEDKFTELLKQYDSNDKYTVIHQKRLANSPTKMNATGCSSSSSPHNRPQSSIQQNNSGMMIVPSSVKNIQHYSQQIKIDQTFQSAQSQVNQNGNNYNKRQISPNSTTSPVLNSETTAKRRFKDKELKSLSDHYDNLINSYFPQSTPNRSITPPNNGQASKGKSILKNSQSKQDISAVVQGNSVNGNNKINLMQKLMEEKETMRNNEMNQKNHESNEQIKRGRNNNNNTIQGSQNNNDIKILNNGIGQIENQEYIKDQRNITDENITTNKSNQNNNIIQNKKPNINPILSTEHSSVGVHIKSTIQQSEQLKRNEEQLRKYEQQIEQLLVTLNHSEQQREQMLIQIQTIAPSLSQYSQLAAQLKAENQQKSQVIQEQASTIKQLNIQLEDMKNQIKDLQEEQINQAKEIKELRDCKQENENINIEVQNIKNNNIKQERQLNHQQQPGSDELSVFEGVDTVENDEAAESQFFSPSLIGQQTPDKVLNQFNSPPFNLESYQKQEITAQQDQEEENKNNGDHNDNDGLSSFDRQYNYLTQKVHSTQQQQQKQQQDNTNQDEQSQRNQSDNQINKQQHHQQQLSQQSENQNKFKDKTNVSDQIFQQNNFKPQQIQQQQQYYQSKGQYQQHSSQQSSSVSSYYSQLQQKKYESASPEKVQSPSESLFQTANPNYVQELSPYSKQQVMLELRILQGEGLVLQKQVTQLKARAEICCVDEEMTQLLDELKRTHLQLQIKQDEISQLKGLYALY